MRLRPAFVASVVLFVASPAWAEAMEEPDASSGTPTTKRVFVDTTLGVGTPVGWAGAGALVLVDPALGLHGGVGLGSQGVQIAAGGRGRIALAPARRLALGLSWSTGRYYGVPTTVTPIPEIGEKRPYVAIWERAHFANAELGYEREWESFLFRTFLGLGVAMNDSDLVVNDTACARHSCSATKSRLVPYFGLAFDFGVL